MSGFIIIPDSMERAMQRDLNTLRDNLPENERETFDAERAIHRQTIINSFAEFGTYPKISGIKKRNTEKAK